MMNIFLMGPTASGKTDCAIYIAQRFPCHIISVDSAMIYRGMDIGTAKPEPQILKDFPHALINICYPYEIFSVDKFCSLAVKEMEKARAENKIPLFVGGSMMYFYALEFGLSHLPESVPFIREKIIQKGQSLGWEALHEELKICDPALANKIKPTDKQRIVRALEVFQTTGLPLSQYQQRSLSQSHNKFYKIALFSLHRASLHHKIETRFKSILEKGFINEVKILFESGDLSPDLPSIRSVGYRQAWEYLENKISYDLMVEKAIIATRQLAKRQITWLRSWPNLNSFFIEDLNKDLLLKEIEKNLGKYDE